MIPEIGHFILVMALMVALAQVTLPATGVWFKQPAMIGLARPLAYAQCVLIVTAFLILTYLFLTNDFSVTAVASYSNSLLPARYKISAVWGGHEGSLLLWVLILSLWGVAVARFSRQLPAQILASVLVVMGAIAVGFLSFSLFTSNPFARHLLIAPLEGADLNPLLQDFGLIVHPPMLYAGYVGFSVAFAFAIAALWHGRLDAAWARWSRPWTTIAWVFLTMGIALGSWWAYYELGWGGWWFWDPVENASFLPWLTGTALIHSLAVTEKRDLLKSWTVLLAIVTFSLCLLGTFLVRSGVLTSVHAFATDPSRGIFMLVFLGVVGGGSLLLYAWKVPVTAHRQPLGAWSRELLLLINNVILLVAMITVLIGTLFPLIMDAFGLGKYSVGPPYFNTVFVPLMALLLLFMGIGPSTHWKRTKRYDLTMKLGIAAAVSVIVGVLFSGIYDAHYSIAAALVVCLSAWLVLGLVVDVHDKCRHASSYWRGLSQLKPAYYGMLIAHVGMACTVLGVGLSSQYSVEQDVRMAPYEVPLTVAGYQFSFQGIQMVTGPNYHGEQAHIIASKRGKRVAVLHPEKRRYFSQQKTGQAITQTAIDPGLWRDLYVALGEPLGSGAWSVRIHYKPFVRWIWLGALLMAVGGVVAVLDRRYRKYKNLLGTTAS